MSTSPIRGSNSDNDWESIFPLTPLKSEDDFSPIPDLRTPEPEDKWACFHPMPSDHIRVNVQLLYLRRTEETGELFEMPQKRQLLFFYTLSLLADEGCLKNAEEILFEADKKGIWHGFEYTRSDSYLLLIEKNIENGTLADALNLYSRACEQSVWKDFPEKQDTAKMRLNKAGFSNL